MYPIYAYNPQGLEIRSAAPDTRLRYPYQRDSITLYPSVSNPEATEDPVVTIMLQRMSTEGTAAYKEIGLYCAR
jgi:hypothetical protein